MEKGSKQARLVVVETLTKSTETCPLHWTHWIVLTRAGMDRWTLYAVELSTGLPEISQCMLREGPYSGLLLLLALKHFIIYNLLKTI